MREPQEQTSVKPELDEDDLVHEKLRPTLGNILKHEGELIDRELKGYRNRTIRFLPSFMVNNSSNAIAGTQLVAEVMMFKANNMDLVKKEHRSFKTAWRFLTDPPVNIWKSVSQGAGLNFKFSDLTRPSYYKDTAKGLFDLKHASEIDSAGGAKLINRWQARSSFMGLTTMLITALVPDSKDNPEEVEKNAVLMQTNPLAYAGKRAYEAVTFPITVVEVLAKKVATLGKYQPADGMGAHKRQFTGLGLLITGIFSFLSGFRNVGMVHPTLGKEAVGNLKYVRNTAHSIGGMITAAAGAQLMMALDNDSGWSRFGATQWLRMIFLPKSISNRYENHDPKANWYVAGQVGMQTANTLSYFIGGAEKLEDGTVVDHTEMRDAARRKAREIKEARKEAKQQGKADEQAKPSTKISERAETEYALPEQRSAKEAELAAHA